MEVPDRLRHFTSHPERCSLTTGAKPEVAMLHQEPDPMLLLGDRELLRQVLHDQITQMNLDTTRGTGILADGTGQPKSGFLGGFLHLFPGTLRKLRPAGDGLYDPAAVSDLQKRDLAARAGGHQPTS